MINKERIGGKEIKPRRTIIDDIENKDVIKKSIDSIDIEGKVVGHERYRRKLHTGIVRWGMVIFMYINEYTLRECVKLFL